MDITSFNNDAKVTSIAVCAHMADNNEADANTLLRMFLKEKTEDDFTLAQCLDALLRCTIDLAVYSAEEGLFKELAVSIAAKYAKDGDDD